MLEVDRVVFLGLFAWFGVIDVNLSLLLFEPTNMTIKFEPADRLNGRDPNDEVFLSGNRLDEPDSSYKNSGSDLPTSKDNMRKMFIMGKYYDVVHEPETYNREREDGFGLVPPYQPQRDLESRMWIPQSGPKISLDTIEKLPITDQETTKLPDNVQTSTTAPYAVKTTTTAPNVTQTTKTTPKAVQTTTTPIPVQTTTTLKPVQTTTTAPITVPTTTTTKAVQTSTTTPKAVQTTTTALKTVQTTTTAPKTVQTTTTIAPTAVQTTTTTTKTVITTTTTTAPTAVQTSKSTSKDIRTSTTTPNDVQTSTKPPTEVQPKSTKLPNSIENTTVKLPNPAVIENHSETVPIEISSTTEKIAIGTRFPVDNATELKVPVTTNIAKDETTTVSSQLQRKPIEEDDQHRHQRNDTIVERSSGLYNSNDTEPAMVSDEKEDFSNGFDKLLQPRVLY